MAEKVNTDRCSTEIGVGGRWVGEEMEKAKGLTNSFDNIVLNTVARVITFPYVGGSREGGDQTIRQNQAPA